MKKRKEKIRFQRGIKEANVKHQEARDKEEDAGRLSETTRAEVKRETG